MVGNLSQITLVSRIGFLPILLSFWGINTWQRGENALLLGKNCKKYTNFEFFYKKSVIISLFFIIFAPKLDD